MLTKIKHYFAIRKARKRAILLGQMIDSIDRAFTRKNIPRYQRRRFWRDFIYSPEARRKFIQDMMLGILWIVFRDEDDLQRRDGEKW